MILPSVLSTFFVLKNLHYNKHLQFKMFTFYLKRNKSPGDTLLNGSSTKQCNKVYYKNIWTSFISMNWSSFAQIFMLNMDPLMRSLICSRLEMFSSNDKILTPYRKSCIFISQMIAMKFFRGRCVNTYLWVETYWPVSNVF